MYSMEEDPDGERGMYCDLSIWHIVYHKIRIYVVPNNCLLLIYLISFLHELITNIKRYGPKMGKKFFNSHNTINKLDYKFIKDG